MNQDDDLMTAVAESASGLHLDVPLDAIMRRGHGHRMRRRLAGAAGIVAVAGAAAVAATTLAPGAATAPTRLAAWTVTTGPDNTVQVTVRQLRDPAGLQQALRADGVPARVAFGGSVVSTNAKLPPECAAPRMSDAANAALQGKIIPENHPGPMNGIALTIRKSAIPDGIGIYLTVQNGSSQSSWGWGLDLVRATAQCTGS
jgi:hypothetical protein